MKENYIKGEISSKPCITVTYLNLDVKYISTGLLCSIKYKHGIIIYW